MSATEEVTDTVKATGIVIADIVSSGNVGTQQRRMFGELTVTCRDFFQLNSNLHDVVSSIPEIPEVRVQLSEWLATLHLCVGQYVQVWGNGFTRNSHPTLGKTSGFLFCFVLLVVFCCYLFLNYLVFVFDLFLFLLGLLLLFLLFVCLFDFILLLLLFFVVFWRVGGGCFLFVLFVVVAVFSSI